MVETTDLNEVWFVVTPQNPFKKSNSLLHEFDRLDMVEKAIADNYKFKVSDIEFHLPKPSYTIDTLTIIQEKNPQQEFVLIMGSDNIVTFQKWKNYEKVLEYFSLYIYPRPNTPPNVLDNHPKILKIEAPLLDISATFIRGLIKKNQSVRYLLPESVEQYIALKKFYQ